MKKTLVIVLAGLVGICAQAADMASQKWVSLKIEQAVTNLQEWVKKNAVSRSYAEEFGKTTSFTIEGDEGPETLSLHWQALTNRALRVTESDVPGMTNGTVFVEFGKDAFFNRTNEACLGFSGLPEKTGTHYSRGESIVTVDPSGAATTNIVYLATNDVVATVYTITVGERTFKTRKLGDETFLAIDVDSHATGFSLVPCAVSDDERDGLVPIVLFGARSSPRAGPSARDGTQDGDDSGYYVEGRKEYGVPQKVEGSEWMDSEGKIHFKTVTPYVMHYLTGELAVQEFRIETIEYENANHQIIRFRVNLTIGKVDAGTDLCDLAVHQVTDDDKQKVYDAIADSIGAAKWRQYQKSPTVMAKINSAIIEKYNAFNDYVTSLKMLKACPTRGTEDGESTVDHEHIWSGTCGNYACEDTKLCNAVTSDAGGLSIAHRFHDYGHDDGSAGEFGEGKCKRCQNKKVYRNRESASRCHDVPNDVSYHAGFEPYDNEDSRKCACSCRLFKLDHEDVANNAEWVCPNVVSKAYKDSNCYRIWKCNRCGKIDANIDMILLGVKGITATVDDHAPSTDDKYQNRKYGAILEDIAPDKIGDYSQEVLDMDMCVIEYTCNHSGISGDESLGCGKKTVNYSNHSEIESPRDCEQAGENEVGTDKKPIDKKKKHVWIRPCGNGFGDGEDGQSESWSGDKWCEYKFRIGEDHLFDTKKVSKSIDGQAEESDDFHYVTLTCLAKGEESPDSLHCGYKYFDIEDTTQCKKSHNLDTIKFMTVVDTDVASAAPDKDYHYAVQKCLANGSDDPDDDHCGKVVFDKESDDYRGSHNFDNETVYSWNDAEHPATESVHYVQKRCLADGSEVPDAETLHCGYVKEELDEADHTPDAKPEYKWISDAQHEVTNVCTECRYRSPGKQEGHTIQIVDSEWKHGTITLPDGSVKTDWCYQTVKCSVCQNEWGRGVAIEWEQDACGRNKCKNCHVVKEGDEDKHTFAKGNKGADGCLCLCGEKSQAHPSFEEKTIGESLYDVCTVSGCGYMKYKGPAKPGPTSCVHMTNVVDSAGQEVYVTAFVNCICAICGQQKESHNWSATYGDNREGKCHELGCANASLDMSKPSRIGRCAAIKHEEPHAYGVYVDEDADGNGGDNSHRCKNYLDPNVGGWMHGPDTVGWEAHTKGVGEESDPKPFEDPDTGKNMCSFLPFCPVCTHKFSNRVTMEHDFIDDDEHVTYAVCTDASHVEGDVSQLGKCEKRMSCTRGCGYVKIIHQEHDTEGVDPIYRDCTGQGPDCQTQREENYAWCETFYKCKRCTGGKYEHAVHQSSDSDCDCDRCLKTGPVEERKWFLCHLEELDQCGAKKCSRCTLRESRVNEEDHTWESDSHSCWCKCGYYHFLVKCDCPGICNSCKMKVVSDGFQVMPRAGRRSAEWYDHKSTECPLDETYGKCECGEYDRPFWQTVVLQANVKSLSKELVCGEEGDLAAEGVARHANDSACESCGETYSYKASQIMQKCVNCDGKVHPNGNPSYIFTDYHQCKGESEAITFNCPECSCGTKLDSEHACLFPDWVGQKCQCYSCKDGDGSACVCCHPIVPVNPEYPWFDGPFEGPADGSMSY